MYPQIKYLVLYIWLLLALVANPTVNILNNASEEFTHTKNMNQTKLNLMASAMGHTLPLKTPKCVLIKHVIFEKVGVIFECTS